MKGLSVFFTRGKIFFGNRTFYFCVSLVLLSSAAFAQNSNIQVTNTTTSGGSWTVTGSGSTTLHTFTPNADNANINATEIMNRLQGSGDISSAGSVLILTTNGVGTQVGNVNFVVSVSAQNRTLRRYGLRVVAGGDIVVMNTLSLIGASNIIGESHGYDVDFSAVGDVFVNVNSGGITTTGGSFSSLISGGGNVLVNAGGDVRVSASITANGGSGNNISTNNTGGRVVLSGGGDIILNGVLSTNGGENNSSTITNVSSGGDVLLSSGGYVKVGASISAIGGVNTTRPSGINSNGGSVSITGAGGVTLTGDITNWNGNNGTLGRGANGVITISSENGSVTSGSGNGVNDGQVSGRLRGGDFVKTGSGVFVLNGSNPYVGTTAVIAGTLRLGSTNSIPITSGLTVTGTLDLGGFSMAVGSLSGGGLISSSGAGSLVLTVSDSGGSTNFSGVIENGTASSVGVTKLGTGTLSLSGSSSYTGPTLVSAGILDIRHSNGLGVSSLTSVSTNAALQLQGGISIGVLPLNLMGTGVSSGGALRNVSGDNSWAGLVTLTSNVQINSDSGVLTLSGATSISSSFSLLRVEGSGSVVVEGTVSLGNGPLVRSGSGTLSMRGRLSNLSVSVQQGVLVLSGSNTYTGTTSVSGGVLRLGASNSIPSASSLVLAGGEFQSGGFSNTFASITLSANSTLRMGSGVHTLTFTNLGTFTAGRTLTIEGWQGTYASPGTTGTAGRIIFNPTTSATILSQIKFNNSGTGNLHSSIQLGTKEIVAGNQ